MFSNWSAWEIALGCLVLVFLVGVGWVLWHELGRR
jgi:hypothetical protein